MRLAVNIPCVLAIIPVCPPLIKEREIMEDILSSIADYLSELFAETSGFNSVYFFAVRIALPLLALIIVLRCVFSLFSGSFEPEEWGRLTLPNGSYVTLYHWENTIGRARTSDVLLNYPTVSRNHGAILRDENGNWTIYDMDSKTGIKVNGIDVVGGMPLKKEDVITLGGVEMVFMPLNQEGEYYQSKMRSKPGREIKAGATLMYLTVFQILLGVKLGLTMGADHMAPIAVSFIAIALVMWLTYIFTRAMRRRAFEIETLVFLLSTAGLAVTASSVPSDVLKHIAFLIAGILMYFAVGWFIRNLNRAKKLRIPIAAAGLILLAVNLVLSEAVFGAKNWLTLFGFSFQPSEFVKIAYVFAGAVTLDRLFNRANLILFIGFAAACVIALALMSDFGTALVFFIAYIVIAFLRSGSIATIFLSVGGAGLAGFLAVTVRPYIADRFATWGHVWDFPFDEGYQQTRTMAAAASGGLFGNGAGNGWLKHIAAANTDMVFGMICEELGLIIGVLLILVIVILAIYVIVYAAPARSSFYVIGAAAAVTLMLAQLILNVLGCVDVLPFTGVTFPFVSKGGSSLIACWGLMAFIKACDTRQNASFTVRLPKRVKTDIREQYVPEGGDVL